MLEKALDSTKPSPIFDLFPQLRLDMYQEERKRNSWEDWKFHERFFFIFQIGFFSHWHPSFLYSKYLNSKL